MNEFLHCKTRATLIVVLVIMVASFAFSQVTSAEITLAGSTQSFEPPSVAGASGPELGSVEVLPDSPGQIRQQNVTSSTQEQPGLVVRSVKRGLEDQKELYLAPLKVKNLKWDALFLTTTGALIATDRQASRAVGKEHLDLSHSVALGSLLGTSAVAGSIWLYGLKTGDRHADETGKLTLETLVNTFLIYTPMQFIAGRERPDDGTGNGRFWVHRNFNTSFPAGHPMFTWAMATVVAHEYPRTWVKLLMYGAATSVSIGRFTGRNHFPSDIFVGSALGYLIGTYIFHAHCDPDLSEACHRSER